MPFSTGISAERSQRIVDAARELANETGNARFTVSQVAHRAGLSLKSVYRCFDGKDDVLLALLEEESRVGAALLSDQVDAHTDPIERIRAFVDGIFALLTHPAAEGYAGVLVREHHRLSEDRHEDLQVALSPLAELLGRQIEAATEAGLVDPGDPDRASATVFRVVLGGVADVVRGRGDAADTAAWVWRFCLHGLRQTTT